MTLIRAFAGLRPACGFAADVAAPPYDVLTSTEARKRAKDRPWSFLHVSKAEIDLPEGVDPYDPATYRKAAENLERMIDQDVLARDSAPFLYVYRIQMGNHRQTGLVAAASVDAYDAGRIRRHEFTRPDKEDDRVRQIDALDSQTGPVLLAYRSEPSVDAMLAAQTEVAPDMDVTADDGVRHTVWVIRDNDLIERLVQAFEAMPVLYIADGHHRSAAASRIAAARRAENPGHHGDEAYNYFLAVMFPHDQMRILDYNRVVRDLNGMDAPQFLVSVEARFEVHPVNDPVRPAKAENFGMYLPGQWYTLKILSRVVPADDPVARLDVSLLQANLLAPVLGIGDPRKDRRIDFVGGIRGLTELERRVDSGEMAVAFSMFPTSMSELMAVADAGEVMPPKSTWFEPKLADGLVSHMIDS